MNPPATGTPVQLHGLAARDAAHLIHPVTEPREMTERGPRIVTAGDGWWVTDDRGRRIIDGFAGLWCVAVGHGRPEIIAAVTRQLEELDYFTTFHGQSHPRAIELAERLAGMFNPAYGLEHVMFSSGGSEANETNFKIVRQYWALRGEDRRTIVARHHGYHGLTIATMSATGILPMHWNFGPNASGFEHVAAPYCYKCELGLTYPDCGLACANSLEQLVEQVGAESIGAFIAEPVIGAGGIIPPPDDYFPRIREICDRHGILLIVDEVVTGFGRTGRMFGHEHWGGIRPDLVTLAKGLTSGYQPLGGSVVADHVWDTIADGLPNQMPFSHGFTYSGHPAACAAALANLDIIERDGLVDNAARVGAYLHEQLHERLGGFETVGEIRGMGLMAGIEFVADRNTKRGFTHPHTACTTVELEAWERGLYCRAMGIETVGLAPPLSIDRDCVDQMVSILVESVTEMERQLLPGERSRAERFSHRYGSAQEIFDRMVERFDADRAADADLVVAFALTGDEGGTWTVTIRDGAMDLSGPADAPSTSPTVTINASAEDYVRMANGELDGAEAFSTQRLSIDGDLTAAVLLSQLGLM
ncbi:MAG: aminotransferase class III-fold pyridoxal phosphate-dependent enzyme [Actinobacteria bacterium]|nr:aminotransferase class III-fold pyridoxal phosphate-dependent enzyme [Actinomycetota bacterium]